VEWHIFFTVSASFFTMLGLLMDLQSLSSGIRSIRSGRSSKPLVFWPFVIYVTAALCWEETWANRVGAILLGFAIHMFCTKGIRSFSKKRAPSG